VPIPLEEGKIHTVNANYNINITVVRRSLFPCPPAIGGPLLGPTSCLLTLGFVRALGR
jgi:hypothetical protein